MSEHTTIHVSREFHERLLEEKPERGISHEAFLRANLPEDIFDD